MGTLTVTVFQISRFSCILYMGGATPTIASLAIFVQNIYIETIVACIKFEVSCCYSWMCYVINESAMCIIEEKVITNNWLYKLWIVWSKVEIEMNKTVL